MTYARLSDEADQAKVDAEKIKGILECESKIFQKPDLKNLEMKEGKIDIILPELD